MVIKWQKMGETLYVLLMVNFLMLMTSLFLITIVPSLIAGARVLINKTDVEEEGVFYVYFKHFKKACLRGILLNIILILWVLILLNWGVHLFDENNWSLLVVNQILLVEVFFSVLASTKWMDEEKNFLRILMRGILAFNIHPLQYALSWIVFVLVLLLIMGLPICFPFCLSLPLVISLRSYQWLSRNTDGDVPISFLKVFEKTN